MLLGWIDVLGYVASVLTLATFAQRTMLPMRLLAIGANVCFIGYGSMGTYMPVLVLHLALLPVNLIRLRTLVSQRGPVEGRPSQEALHHSIPPGVSSGLL